MSTVKRWRKIVGWMLFVVLLASVAYSVYNIFTAPSSLYLAEEYERIKSDYVNLLFQCLFGIIIMFLPALIERKFSVEIPNYMYFLFFIFLFCAIYLGEVHDFYYVIPYWDIILHSISGIMLGTLGFSFIYILNDSPKVRLNLSPLFVALFAFCFAVAGGAIWEIYEFCCDYFFGFNMQKFALKDGTLLIGQMALADTMGDLIADSLSALLVSIFGFITLYNGRKQREQRKIRRMQKKSRKKNA